MKNYKFINYILLFFFSFLFLFFLQLLLSGSRLDFYWNYNNSLQISNGLIPYKDISLLTTTLFHYIVSFFLLLFGKNIIIYSIVITIFKLLHLYVLVNIVILLCNKYKIKEKNRCFLLSFYLGIILMYSMYYEYNFLSLLFISIITYIELLDEKDIKYNILIGLLGGLSLLSKQSIGLIAIIFILLKLFKNDKKSILYRIIGIIIPIALFIIYLLFTKSLDSFISYSIFGVSSFSNNVSFIESITGDYKISIIKIILAFSLLISLIIFIIWQIYLIFSKKYDKYKKILLYYSIISISCFYPLRDIHHLIPIIVTFIPLFIISIMSNNYKIIFNFKYNRLIGMTLFIACSMTPMNMYINIFKGNNKNYIVLKENYNSVNGIVVDRLLKSNIDDIVNFEKEMEEKGINTIILNKSSVLFHVVQNKYYKDYDLFMKGNFGNNGEERIINDIKNSNNIIYLINRKDEEKKPNLIQLPNKIYNYVVNNLNSDGQILYFTIYSK